MNEVLFIAHITIPSNFDSTINRVEDIFCDASSTDLVKKQYFLLEITTGIVIFLC